jgi:hypothetical protein
MTLRMPPRYYNTPTRARFRKHRLPPELWDTWELFNALSWINDYKFTPPTSSRDIAHVLNIGEDALYDRTARLEQLCWLTVDRQKGKTNVYHPLVPEDTCKTVEDCDCCAEGTSMIHDSGEDSSRVTGTALGNARQAELPELAQPTSGVHSTSSNSTVVVVDLSKVNDLNQTTKTTNSTTPARAKAEHALIFDALDVLGIITPEATSEILGFEHVTAEYVEDWVASREEIDPKGKLSGGYYRMQIRANRKPPYRMTESGRAEFRQENAERRADEQVAEPA